MDNMLSKALREFTTGPLNQLIVNLGGQDGDQWETELKHFLRKEPCWSDGQVAKATQPKPKPSILEPISTVTVFSATSANFVAKDNFKLKKDGGICSFLGDNFKDWFLSGDGKIEEPITEQVLRYAKLRKSSLDSPIIKELGGEEKAETSLTEIFSLMEKQSKGEEGVLLTNGWANIFYVKGRAGMLRTVDVFWCDDGWGVDADEVSDPFSWSDDDQVFSRNPLEALVSA